MTERPLDCYNLTHNVLHSGEIFIIAYCVDYKHFDITNKTFIVEPHFPASNYPSKAVILLFGKS